MVGAAAECPAQSIERQPARHLRGRSRASVIGGVGPGQRYATAGQLNGVDENAVGPLGGFDQQTHPAFEVHQHTSEGSGTRLRLVGDGGSYGLSGGSGSPETTLMSMSSGNCQRFINNWSIAR